MEADEFVDIARLARRVGRSVDTLRRLERQGRIPKAMREPLSGRRLWTEEQAESVQKLFAPRCES